MRPLWIMAFVLLAAPMGAFGQEPEAPAAESPVTAEPGDAAEPADTVETPDAAETVDADEAQVEGEPSEVPSNVEPGEAEPAPPIERIEGVEPSSSIQEVDQDDLPPSLRDYEAPPSAPVEVRAPLSPWKGYVGVGTGLGFHLNAQREFQQTAIAPAYLHLRGGVVLPGRGRLRHALQLGVGTNLSQEGTHPSGTLALRQWLVVPSYVLRIGLDDTALPTWLISARVGVPVVLSPDVTVGAEVAAGAQFFARSGFAIYSELIYDVFAGGRRRDGGRSTHHLFAIELGVQIELESLP